MGRNAKPVFSPESLRASGCGGGGRRQGERGQKRKSEAIGKGNATLKIVREIQSIPLIFLREQETQNHSINIANHKTPSVLNYHHLKECAGGKEEGEKGRQEHTEHSLFPLLWVSEGLGLLISHLWNAPELWGIC